MNHIRTLKNLTPRWMAGEFRRLPFILLLLPLAVLIWPLGGFVRSQTAVVGDRIAADPLEAPDRVPLLSDPLIDRISAGAKSSADGSVIVYVEPLAGCQQSCPTQVIFEDAASGSREIASVGLSGTAIDSPIHDLVLSGDGRNAAFSSPAANLVQGDTNNAADIFLYDRAAHATRRLSVTQNGGQADGDSYLPALSADGRYVTFASYAENLVPGDTNRHSDIFLADLEIGTMRLLSLDAVSQPSDQDAHKPVISGDGKTVTFSSAATHLVTGDTNAAEDVFSVDVEQGRIVKISTAGNGGQADGDSFDVAVSTDGRYAAFASYAKNLTDDPNPGVNVFLHDLDTNRTQCVSCMLALKEGGQAAWKPRFSPDGSLLLFDILVQSYSGEGVDRVTQIYGYDVAPNSINQFRCRWFIGGDDFDTSLPFL